MCGISGIYRYKDAKSAVDRGLVANMTDVIRHRGPDDEGFYVKGNIGLGHRRLSIIDLEGGHQPVHNEDGTVWIVFNGEIYNYQSLYDELVAKGHVFYTRSDTETMVHLYEEYGEDFVTRLRGMFAFAIWDEKKKKLILARDHTGIKPLFYRIKNGTLSFGSEIKCLLEDGSGSREMDMTAFDHFLTFSYTPGPKTFFEGVVRLAPAHMLICTAAGPSTKRYWELEFKTDYSKGLEDFKAEALELTKESVRLQLISDVPLGAFLSGGIDSSSVVALMSEVSGRSVDTFSIGYSDAGEYFNELPYARMVAEKYHSNHMEFIVTPEIEGVIHDIIRAFDEPFADSSIIPSYYICKLAREHVKVALSGLGGDELFGGYERYSGLLASEYYNRIPSVLRNVLPALVKMLPESNSGVPTVARLKRFITGASLPPDSRYYSYLTGIRPEEKYRLINRDLQEHIDKKSSEELISRHYNSANATSPLDRATNVDLNVYLPDDILTLTDRISMMHSLEVRVPLLDHVLLEFAMTIPPEYKIHRFRKKYIFTEAMAGHLPDKILNKKKIGFASPFAQWFRNSLKEFTTDMLSENRVKRRGFFNPTAVNAILEDHFRKKRSLQRQILSLLTFEIWCQNYLDNTNQHK